MKCKHECPSCYEEWECDFPFNSEFSNLETTMSLGYYCNSWCPACDSKERDNLDELFNGSSKTGYFKGLRHYSILKTLKD